MKQKNRIFLIIFSLIILLLIITFGLFKISKLRNFQFFGTLISRVETNEKVIALTFDDAPNEYSNQIVDTLAEKNVKATFYMIGQNIEKHPEEAKYIIDQQHELGNHSYSHHRFLLKSLSFIDNEIQTTNQLIHNTGYLGEITFRPPYGKKLFLLPWYLKKHQIKTIMWDLEPDTYVNGEKEIVDYIIQNIKPGSIILLHPFCETACEADRKALPQIIDQLHQKGYKFITISELLKYK